jgi:hypothetical protein
MSGCTSIDVWYFFVCHSSPVRSMPYFGVRVNSVSFRKTASSTARVLFTARPMPTAITTGRYFSRDIQSVYSSRWHTV